MLWLYVTMDSTVGFKAFAKYSFKNWTTDVRCELVASQTGMEGRGCHSAMANKVSPLLCSFRDLVFVHTSKTRVDYTIALFRLLSISLSLALPTQQTIMLACPNSASGGCFWDCLPGYGMTNGLIVRQQAKLSLLLNLLQWISGLEKRVQHNLNH